MIYFLVFKKENKMKYCRILSLKRLPNYPIYNHKNSFMDYTNELKENIRKQKGFQGIEYFWVSDIQCKELKDTTLISISNWKDISYWNQWYESSIREKISKQYSFKDKEEINYKLIKKKENEHIFLL